MSNKENKEVEIKVKAYVVIAGRLTTQKGRPVVYGGLIYPDEINNPTELVKRKFLRGLEKDDLIKYKKELAEKEAELKKNSETRELRAQKIREARRETDNKELIKVREELAKEKTNSLNLTSKIEELTKEKETINKTTNELTRKIGDLNTEITLLKEEVKKVEAEKIALSKGNK